MATRYDRLLFNLPSQLLEVLSINSSAFHLYVVCLANGGSGKTQFEVFEDLKLNDIGVNLNCMLVQIQPYYRQFGFQEGQFSEAESHSATAITFPLHLSMTKDDQDKVIENLGRIL